MNQSKIATSAFLFAAIVSHAAADDTDSGNGRVGRMGDLPSGVTVEDVTQEKLDAGDFHPDDIEYENQGDRISQGGSVTSAFRMDAHAWTRPWKADTDGDAYCANGHIGTPKPAHSESRSGGAWSYTLSESSLAYFKGNCHISRGKVTLQSYEASASGSVGLELTCTLGGQATISVQQTIEGKNTGTTIPLGSVSVGGGAYGLGAQVGPAIDLTWNAPWNDETHTAQAAGTARPLAASDETTAFEVWAFATASCDIGVDSVGFVPGTFPRAWIDQWARTKWNVSFDENEGAKFLDAPENTPFVMEEDELGHPLVNHGILNFVE